MEPHGCCGVAEITIVVIVIVDHRNARVDISMPSCNVDIRVLLVQSKRKEGEPKWAKAAPSWTPARHNLLEIKVTANEQRSDPATSIDSRHHSILHVFSLSRESLLQDSHQ